MLTADTSFSYHLGHVDVLRLSICTAADRGITQELWQSPKRGARVPGGIGICITFQVVQGYWGCLAVAKAEWPDVYLRIPSSQQCKPGVYQSDWPHNINGTYDNICFSPGYHVIRRCIWYAFHVNFYQSSCTPCSYIWQHLQTHEHCLSCKKTQCLGYPVLAQCHALPAALILQPQSLDCIRASCWCSWGLCPDHYILQHWWADPAIGANRLRPYASGLISSPSPTLCCRQMAISPLPPPYLPTLSQ